MHLTHAALTLQEVDNATDHHIVGTFEENFVLSDSALESGRSVHALGQSSGCNSTKSVVLHAHSQPLLSASCFS